MPENISCPHCGSVLALPDEFKGREVRCPDCVKLFVAGGQTDFTAQAPRPIISDVQSGPPPLSESSPWRESRRDDDRGYDDDHAEDRRDFRLSGVEFKPGGGLVITLKVMLVLNVVLCLLMLGSGFMQYNLTKRLIAGANVPDAEILGNDARELAIGLADSFVVLASAVVFAMWSYRVHANLRPLGARHLTYTSGWAAGAWFVPILNLYRPVQIAQEIWRNSDPKAVTDGELRLVTPANSSLIGIWWAAWLLSNIISQVSVRMAWSATTPRALQDATVVNMISDIATIPAAILALLVVSAIDSRQNIRYEAMATSRW